MSAPVAWQRVWDDAALLAARGLPLVEIIARMEDNASPDVTAHVARTVPRHGRTFWLSMTKTLVAGAVLVALLLFMRSLARPLPGLTEVICVVIGLCSVAIGVMAGHQRVRNRRQRLLVSDREAVRRVADEAARAVWRSQIPGRWDPAGPEPGPLPATAVDRSPAARTALAGAWLRRWGSGDPMPPVVLGETAPAAVRALAGAGPRPVTARPPVIFTTDPALDDETKRLADQHDLAVFSFSPRAADSSLQPLSAAARRLWAAYRSPVTDRAPVDLLRAQLGPAETAR